MKRKGTGTARVVKSSAFIIIVSKALKDAEKALLFHILTLAEKEGHHCVYSSSTICGFYTDLSFFNGLKRLKVKIFTLF